MLPVAASFRAVSGSTLLTSKTFPLFLAVAFDFAVAVTCVALLPLPCDGYRGFSRGFRCKLPTSRVSRVFSHVPATGTEAFGRFPEHALHVQDCKNL
jgi:hypothetical protein